MNDNKFEMILQKGAAAMQENLYLKSITGGLMSLLPVFLIGAIFTLIDGIPIDAYQDFLVNSGAKAFTGIPAELTNNLIALYASFIIAYKLASELKRDGASAGVLSLLSFLIVTPLGTLAGEEGGVALPTFWLGATGLFAAMFIAVFVGRVYCLILDKGWYIKMPAGVPPAIERSFGALVPGFVFVTIMLILSAIFAATPFGSVHGFVFGLVQAPLVNIGGSAPAFIIMILISHVLWFFGIHGMMIIFSVMMPVLMPLSMENMAAFQAGQTPPNMIVLGTLFLVVVGGSGATLGLVMAMMRAKSARYRTLGKLAIVPGICGINEPIIFGTPMVLNPRFLIPFIGTPTIIGLLTVILTAIGVLPTLNGIIPPLGVPVVLVGFMMGGWRIAVWQVVTVAISFFAYYPFFKIADAEAFAEENAETGDSLII